MDFSSFPLALSPGAAPLIQFPNSCQPRHLAAEMEDEAWYLRTPAGTPSLCWASSLRGNSSSSNSDSGESELIDWKRKRK